MPIMSVIKNNAYGDMLCSKVPVEDFNIGSQLIVAEYEEALFMKDGIVEEVFGPGKYTLTTENYPFLTKFISRLVTGGVSAYNCKVYYINKSHHFNLKWGTGQPLRIIDPYWQIEVHVQARGEYNVEIVDGKKFFLKFVGAFGAADDNDITKKFRVAFTQHITDELAEYLSTTDKEVLVTCNKKKQLAEELKPVLNRILDSYGLSVVDFYIENIGVPEDDECMARIRELRMQRQERAFNREQSAADARLEYGLRQESSVADRYVSGQMAQADYERMKIRDQDGNNGWARQETAEILKTAAANQGTEGEMLGIGFGLAAGQQIGSMMMGMYDPQAVNNPLNDNTQVPKNDNKSVICAKCNAVLPPGMKFCGNCGSPLVPQKVFCPNCNTEVPAGMKFCGNCGTKVAE